MLLKLHKFLICLLISVNQRNEKVRIYKLNRQIMKNLINRIQHIGLPVTNIFNSVAFYQQLGFENAMESTFQEDGQSGTCIMMKNKDIIIELYQLPEHKLQEIRERKDGHIDHITFDVDDIHHAFQTLKEENFTIIEEQPVYLPFWKNGCKYFNITGPDGERLEFNQIL